MANIVLRNVKGTPLTAAEMDNNLSGLNDELIISGSVNTVTKNIDLVTRSASVPNISFSYQPIIDEATAMAIAFGG